MNDLTILGGGPAGLAVAFYAHRAGIPFVLFERASRLGGMCRTLTHREHRYDCGAHRFHDRDPEITRDVVQLMGDELQEVKAPSKVWDRGHFVDFPPTPASVIFSSSLRDMVQIGAEVLRARRNSAQIISFEDFAIHQFGESLSRRILLNYSEKLWGLPAKELSPDVATRRLQGMTLRSLVTSVLFPNHAVDHLDGSFLYPRGGYGRIVESIAGTLPKESLVVDSEIARIQLDGNCVARIDFTSGSSYEPSGRVVSTLPITVLTKMLGDEAPIEAREAVMQLRFRHTRLIVLFIRRAQISPNASIYIPDPQFRVSRLYEPKNRSVAMAPENETSLVAELPCFSGDAICNESSATLANIVVDELCALRLIERDEIIDWKEHFLPNAYPVYTLDYSATVTRVFDALSSVQNLDILGRAGRFYYSHLHDHLRLGKSYVAERTQSEI